MFLASVLVDYEGAVTIIGINNPDKRNCVNPVIAQELTKAIEDFENDEKSLVAVLHGTGGNFCAGFDLKYLANFDVKNESAEKLMNQHGSMVLY